METGDRRGEEDELADAQERRVRLRRLEHERLRRYVDSIIREQTKPLREIIREGALRYLPVRSLLRLCAVSRDWNAHISTPFFGNRQTFFNLSLSGLFCCTRFGSDPPTFYLPFHPASAHGIPDPVLSFLPDGATHVKASSSGLLCCSYQLTAPPRYHICNPATREWAELPPPSVFRHQGVALDFRPSLTEFSGDFRLMCTYLLPNRSGGVSREFEVFSSAAGEWETSLHRSLSQNFELLAWQGGVAVGGKAYWRTAGGGILCFDPEGAGRSEVLEVPEEASGGWAEWKLGAAEGRLCCAVHLVRTEEMGEIGVHLLTAGGGWVRARGIEVAGPVRLLGVGGGEVLVMAEGGAVVGFSVATGEGRLLLCESAASTTDGDAEFVPYVSSLAPVKRPRPVPVQEGTSDQYFVQ